MTSEVLQGDLLAEETHSGRAWAFLIALALIGPVVGVMTVPTAPLKFALTLACILVAGALAMAMTGFQYRFLRHGVEVRTLGFRLRSIPKQSILSYSIESWGLPRGYGIRAAGSTRAYVWGNKVVHIKTTNGEIYLGHDDPERIVRDLDQVTGFVSRG